MLSKYKELKIDDLTLHWTQTRECKLFQRNVKGPWRCLWCKVGVLQQWTLYCRPIRTGSQEKRKTDKIPISTPICPRIYVPTASDTEKEKGDWSGKLTNSNNMVSRTLARAVSKAKIKHMLSMSVIHCGHLRNGYSYHWLFLSYWLFASFIILSGD